MVNKTNLKMVYQGMYHLFFLLLFLSPLTGNAQKIDKYFTSSIQEEGTLYYILPQEIVSDKSDCQYLEYDITSSTSKKTVRINFSLFIKTEEKIEKIGFQIGEETFSYNCEKIFIDTKKSKWHYRYGADVPFDKLQAFFRENNAPHIYIYSKGEEIDLVPDRTKWKKYSAINSKIFTLITYNRNE